LTAALTRYVSIASILATAAYPLLAYLYHEPAVVMWSAAAGSALIIVKHHQNIRRLIAGKETRIGSAGRSG
jgi:glycerol-3-phosphate acyltransferase PlsY